MKSPVKKTKKREIIFDRIQLDAASLVYCKEPECPIKHTHLHSVNTCNQHKCCGVDPLETEVSQENELPQPLPLLNSQNYLEKLAANDFEIPRKGTKVLVTEYKLDSWFAMSAGFDINSIPFYRPPNMSKQTYDTLKKYAQLPQDMPKKSKRQMQRQRLKSATSNGSVNDSSKPRISNLAGKDGSLFKEKAGNLFQPDLFPQAKRIESFVDTLPAMDGEDNDRYISKKLIATSSNPLQEQKVIDTGPFKKRLSVVKQDNFQTNIVPTLSVRKRMDSSLNQFMSRSEIQRASLKMRKHYQQSTQLNTPRKEDEKTDQGISTVRIQKQLTKPALSASIISGSGRQIQKYSRIRSAATSPSKNLQDQLKFQVVDQPYNYMPKGGFQSVRGSLQTTTIMSSDLPLDKFKVCVSKSKLSSMRDQDYSSFAGERPIDILSIKKQFGARILKADIAKKFSSAAASLRGSIEVGKNQSIVPPQESKTYTLKNPTAQKTNEIPDEDSLFFGGEGRDHPQSPQSKNRSISNSEESFISALFQQRSQRSQPNSDAVGGRSFYQRIDPRFINNEVAEPPEGAIDNCSFKMSLIQPQNKKIKHNIFQDAEYWLNKGVTALKTEGMMVAYDYYIQGIRANNGSFSCVYNLACICSLLEKHANAKKWFDYAISLQPGTADAYYGSALSGYQLRMYEDAYQSLKRIPQSSASLFVKTEDISYLRAMTMKRMGLMEEAKAEYKSIEHALRQSEGMKLVKHMFSALLLPLNDDFKVRIIGYNGSQQKEDYFTNIMALTFQYNPDFMYSMETSQTIRALVDSKLQWVDLNQSVKLLKKFKFFSRIPEQDLLDRINQLTLEEAQLNELLLTKEDVIVILNGRARLRLHSSNALSHEYVASCSQGSIIGFSEADDGLSNNGNIWAICATQIVEFIRIPLKTFKELWEISRVKEKEVFFLMLQQSSFVIMLSLQTQYMLAYEVGRVVTFPAGSKILSLH